jgi:hypothetical protein
MRLGEHLVLLGVITEDELYEALSLQQSLPSGRLEPWVISSNVARALPRRVVRDWRVLPFRISSGNMFLASPEIPTDDLTRALRGFHPPVAAVSFGDAAEFRGARRKLALDPGRPPSARID